MSFAIVPHHSPRTTTPTSRYIGTARFTPDDSDGRATLWTMRLGPAVGAKNGYATLKAAEASLRSSLVDTKSAAAIVQQGLTFQGRLVVARETGSRAQYAPWSFAREDLPGDNPVLTTAKHAQAAGIVKIVDVDRHGKLVTMGVAGAR